MTKICGRKMAKSVTVEISLLRCTSIEVKEIS
jgi:hypothetical protein